MGERILIANVGERDLWYDVGPACEPVYVDVSWRKDDLPIVSQHLGCAPGARHVGAALLGRHAMDPEVTLAHCAFPLIGSLLDHLTQEEPLDRLLLVATDQPAASGRERDRDSVFTAQVVALLVARNYGTRVRLVETTLYHDHPGPEEAYRFFGNLLRALSPKYPRELHIATSGGIPQLNTALQQQAFRLFPRVSRIHQVVPRTNGPVPGSLVRDAKEDEFIHDLLGDVIERLVRRWDYRGALDAIRPYTEQLQMPGIVELLEHGAARSSLSYAVALKTLPSGHGEKRLQLEHAARGDLLARAVEAFHLMEIRRDAGRTHDVLWLARAVMTGTRELKWLPNGDHRYVDAPRYSVLTAMREAVEYRAIKKLANQVLHDLAIPAVVHVAPPGRGKPIPMDTEVLLRKTPNAIRKFLEAWMRIEGQTYSLEGHPYAKLNDAIRAAARRPLAVSPLEDQP